MSSGDFVAKTRERLRGLVEVGAIKQAAVARVMKCSEGTVSSFVNGKIASVEADKKYAQKIAAYLDELTAKATAEFPEIVTASVENLKRVHHFVKTLHPQGFGLIVGEPGLGKTRSLDTYVESHPAAIYIRCNQAMTPKDFLRRMCKATGIDQSGRVGDMFTRLVDALEREKPRTVIVDELERLPRPFHFDKICDLLASLWEDAQTVMVFSGTPRLERLIRQSVNLDYVRDRIGRTLRLREWSLDDTAALLKAGKFPRVPAGAAQNGLAKAIHRLGGSNGRDVQQLLENAHLLAHLGGREIDVAVLEKAMGLKSLK